MWRVEFHPRFVTEFEAFPEEVQEEIASMVNLLRLFGPQLKRPRSDTLNGSAYANMKELRFDADGGVWRLAYAFDPERNGILLVAGDKSGVSSKQFYKGLIRRADERFKEHMAALKARKT
jgi:hypothetical protein